MLRLRVLRHGESTWNALGRMQGRTHGVALSARGWQQAAGAARALRAETDGPALVVSSDQVRARQTADVVAAALGCGVRLSPLLRERAYGDFEARPVAAFERWAAGAPPDCYPVHGVETWEGVRRRAVAALTAVMSEVSAGVEAAPDDVDVVVVSHGDTLRALLAATTGAPGLPPILGNGEYRTTTWPVCPRAEGAVDDPNGSPPRAHRAARPGAPASPAAQTDGYLRWMFDRAQNASTSLVGPETTSSSCGWTKVSGLA